MNLESVQQTTSFCLLYNARFPSAKPRNLRVTSEMIHKPRTENRNAAGSLDPLPAVPAAALGNRATFPVYRFPAGWDQYIDQASTPASGL